MDKEHVKYSYNGVHSVLKGTNSIQRNALSIEKDTCKNTGKSEMVMP